MSAQVKGTINQWELTDNKIQGNVDYEGEQVMIKTSSIDVTKTQAGLNGRTLENLQEGDLVETKNSIYRLGDKKPE